MLEQPEFGPLLAEGKTKQLYAYPGDDTLAYMVSKDQITAGDGARRNELAGKSRWSTITTANVMHLLNEENLDTAFVRASQRYDVTGAALCDGAYSSKCSDGSRRVPISNGTRK